MIRPVSQFAPRGDCQFGIATRWSARINASYFYYSIIGLRSNKKVYYFFNRAMTLLSIHYSNKKPINILKITKPNYQTKLPNLTVWSRILLIEHKKSGSMFNMPPPCGTSSYLNLKIAECVVPSFNSRVNNWQVPAHAGSVCQVNL